MNINHIHLFTALEFFKGLSLISEFEFDTFVFEKHFVFTNRRLFVYGYGYELNIFFVSRLWVQATHTNIHSYSSRSFVYFFFLRSVRSAAFPRVSISFKGIGRNEHRVETQRRDDKCYLKV